jgi:hypothetical protein
MIVVFDVEATASVPSFSFDRINSFTALTWILPESPLGKSGKK